MRISALVESLDELEEPLRGLYEENEHGEYVLRLDGVDKHPTVRGLRRALETAKAQRQEMREQLQTFQPLRDAVGEEGDLTETVHDLVARLQSPGTPSEDLDARLEARVKAIEAKHQRELQQLQQQLERREAAVRKHVLEAQLHSQLEAVGVPSEAREAVASMLERKGLTVHEVDGDFRAVFPTDFHGVPEANQPLAEYIGEWAKSDAAAFFLAPTNASGSGAPPRGGRGSETRRVVTRDQLRAGDFDIDSLAKGKSTVVG